MKPIHILLVEDNPGDAELTREALADAKIANTLSVVVDGEEAMDFLHTRGPHADVDRPDVVLLDLNLPKMDGREVLAAIKGDPELRRLPVIVMTTSAADDDIARAYDDHANAYIQKPIDFDEFIRTVRSVENFWLSIVKLPTRVGD